MSNEEILGQEKTRLDKHMREEMQPFIVKVVEGKTTIETIDEAKKKQIVDKYDNLYNTFETTLLNTPPTYQELREKEYLAKGLTPEKLVIGLWEDVVEGRPEEKNRLQALRQAIKDKYPKK